MTDKKHFGILSAEIESPTGEFQLLPAGSFRAKDGRPKDARTYVLNEPQATALIAAFNAQSNPMMVDYEHQAVFAKENGKPAPAAGWVHGLEWRPGKGLFAVQVEWTEAAKSAIQADEYRYISPVFTYTPKTGEVISLYNAALTNVPALDGMESAVAHSLQPADDALKEMSAQLEALKASILCKDEAHELLKRRIEADEVERIVDGYVGTGKLCPAERDAALTLARHDITAVQKILDARPSFFVMQSDECNTAHHAGAHGKYPANLNPDDVRICELTGRSPEEFAALKVKYSTDDNPFHI